MKASVCATAAIRGDQVRIIRAHSLLFARGEVLADFEAELIREVHRRVIVQKGYVASVTDAEWQVLDGALEAMLRAPRQDLTNMGLAA